MGDNGGWDPKSACIRILRGHASSLRDEEKSIMTFMDGENLYITWSLFNDVAELTKISCTDIALVSTTKVVGVASKAKLMGDKAYAALLEALLKASGDVPGLTSYHINNDALTLVIVFPYCEAQRIAEEMRREGRDVDLNDVLGYAAGYAIIVRTVLVAWALDALEKLSRGEKPKPLDIDEALRKSRGEDERGFTMDPYSSIL